MTPLDKKQNKTTVRRTEQMQRPGDRKEPGARTGLWWPALVPAPISFADFAGDMPSCEKHFSFIRTCFLFLNFGERAVLKYFYPICI